jgi:DNA-binding response OmpR family regulator
VPAQNVHIVVVDDDAKVRMLLRRCFEPEGYRVSEAEDGEALFSILRSDAADLITLDLTLPGESGLELARRIRASSAVPIVMVTGKGETIDKVVGLEVGADDYISKPFHVREVLARVRSVLRRAEGHGAPGPAEAAPAGEVYRFDHWTIDLPRRELRSESGEVCPLTTSEFELLAVLVQRPNRVLSRDQLMDLLKGRQWAAYDRSIDSQIARLRKKIEPGSGSPQLIKTVRGAGYSFTADVRRT